ncbi:MAG: DUF5715 family protein [Odoribacter sp.]
MCLMKYILTILLFAFLMGCGGKQEKDNFQYFKNYQRTFNDLNDAHLRSARYWGIRPLNSEDNLDGQSNKLEEISSCRYYELDELTHSLPYLVPRAEELLEMIGRNFRDAVDSKGLSSCKIIVTSVLRTYGSVRKLKRKNTNASANSAHVYGTTFDIAYGRFKGAADEDIKKLKSILAEVLQDLRKQKKCYVRYEYKQGCFHITVR